MSPEGSVRELLCVWVSDTLSDMGIESPKSFPSELESYFSENEGSGDRRTDVGDGFGTRSRRTRIQGSSSLSSRY